VAAAGVPDFQGDFLDGLRQAFELIVSGDPLVVSTTLRTLRLAIEATAMAAAVGLPLGCLLGVGRFRGRHVALGIANALTKVPPVAVGVLGLLLIYPSSPWGGGPLAGLGWRGTSASGTFVQTLLAVPIVVALTASAVQGVAPGLLAQARAFGAPGWRTGALALREARAAVVAGVLVAMGVTITAVGAIIVVGAGANVSIDGGTEPPSLAIGALTAFTSHQATTDRFAGLAVAYATILLGLFVLIAAALTRLQLDGSRPIAGRAS
jgi:tungstate transport system permease protein